MSILDKDWKYNDRAETDKPGYLSRRMELYRYRIKKEAEAAEALAKKEADVAAEAMKNVTALSARKGK